MTIIRGAGPGDEVVAILRTAAQDRRLSYKARGLLVAVMSRPPDWRTDADRLADDSPDGRYAVLTALDELAAAGYLRRRRERLRNGRIVTSWEISDAPRFAPNNRRQRRPTGGRFSAVGSSDAGAPDAGSPAVGSPDAGSSAVGSSDAGVPDVGGSAVGSSDAGAADVGEPSALLEGETKGETPPPTPAAEPAAGEVLAGVVVAALQRKGAQRPSARGLALECRRLAADGWTAEGLDRVVSDHDWAGARAGAVVALLRGLAPADRPAPAATTVERGHRCPDCGTPVRTPGACEACVATHVKPEGLRERARAARRGRSGASVTDGPGAGGQGLSGPSGGPAPAAVSGAS